MLLQLPTLPQVPGADGVVQASGPQLGAIVGDVDAAGSVCVTLELPVGEKNPKIHTNRVSVHRTTFAFSIHASISCVCSGPCPLPHSYLTSVWLCKSHTAMFPSLQQEKQTFESGLMARA